MSRNPSDSEIDPVEAALGKLRPAHRPIDRDRLMFEAGVASARAEARGRWVWPSIAAALALVCTSESIVLATRLTQPILVRESPVAEEGLPVQIPVEIIVQRSPAASSPDASSWGDADALRLRRQLLRLGPEGLPDLPPLLSLSDVPESGADTKAGSPEELRRLEIEKLLNPGGPS